MEDAGHHRLDFGTMLGQPDFKLAESSLLCELRTYLFWLRMHGQSVWIEAFVVRHGGGSEAKRLGAANSS